ncbi:MAG: hypothetical protein BWY89_02052 [Bacteroidetes bacterium ADurb.BinA012]|jgi:hypothetical protein|nr:MAG: hypothetical protein BWY89_02052 [Bacteroidetes bacterium ADurb.BinA012]
MFSADILLQNLRVFAASSEGRSCFCPGKLPLRSPLILPRGSTGIRPWRSGDTRILPRESEPEEGHPLLILHLGLAGQQLILL